VRDAEGTHEAPVPEDRRTQAVLNPTQAAELTRIGVQIENLFGRPMDIEWLSPMSVILCSRPADHRRGRT